MTMSAPLGEAQVQIRATLDKLDRDLAPVRGKVAQAIDGIQTVGKVALGGVLAGGAAATAAVAGLGKLAIDAAPLENIQSAFEGIAESAGSSMDVMLGALKDGSAGMVSNRDLMLSFNKAAQLVSEDFATQLPDAMQYLQKVSAATGQDIGFLLDSLVTGVGRLSPLILDNLAIQVSQAEATERAAEMFGVEAEELTKAQQQAGMMNVVMEKLAENTASMPDVTDSASAKMARFRATMQDTKDRIGMALLPALSTVMDTFGELAGRVLPPVVSAFENHVGPAVEGVAKFISNLIIQLGQTEGVWEAITMAFEGTPFEDLQGGFIVVSDAIQRVIDTVAPYIQMAWNWISQNVRLEDVLIALGIAVGTVVIPAIAGIIAAAAPVVLIFGALVGAVALVRTAWENNWGGIQEKTAAVVAAVGPAFETVRAWLAEKIPVAMAAVSQFWNETLQPALSTMATWLGENIPIAMEAISTFWTETLMPTFETIATWLGENIPVAVETLTTLWNETLLPAFEGFWAFMNDYIFPIVEDVVGILGDLGRLGFEGLANLWNTTLKPALEGLWTWLGNVFSKAGEVNERFGIVQGIVDGVKKAFGGLKSALETVHRWLDKVKQILDKIHIPSGLQPGSPSPFEMSLRGITDQAREATRALESMDRAMPGARGGLGMAGAGGVTMVLIPVDITRFQNLRGETDYAGVGEYILREKLG